MSVVAPGGFRAAGVAAGIKGDALDLAVVICDTPATAAGVFTRNLAAAPPVHMTRDHIADGSATAIVVNSGCANAATGAQGLADARTMAAVAAAGIGCGASDVLVCSTGTIGPYLPMPEVRAGIESAIGAADSTDEQGTAAATAILTTDSVIKEVVVHGDGYVVGGMAKGAGMVRPDMATMLAFLTTDAEVDAPTLQASLTDAADTSFNSLNIDGCESTNDTVLVLASGSSGVRPEPGSFARVLAEACRTLATAMARDAEGASRMVTIDVTGAVDDATARMLGRAIADSALVRSSFYGGDVNWGRVLGALGATRTNLALDDVTIAYEGVVVSEAGIGAEYDEPALLEACAEGDLHLEVTVGAGAGEASVITTDLTPEYVVFNGERS